MKRSAPRPGSPLNARIRAALAEVRRRREEDDRRRLRTPHPILTQLRSDGYRITRARTAIVQRLAEERRPVSAREIAQKVTLRHRLVAHETTLYRELAFLEGRGHLLAVNLGDGTKRYELAGGEHHHHRVCTTCARVEDLPVDAELERAIRATAARDSFRVTRHSLDFFGTCGSCTRP